MNGIRVFGESVVFHVGPLAVTDTAITAFMVSAGLIVIAVLLRSAVLDRPGSAAAIAGELAVQWLDDLVTDVVGHPAPGLAVFSGALFFFIAGSAIAGQMPGVRAPTASVAATSALAFLVFVAVPVAGIRAKGFGGYLRDYVRPNPLLAPLHIMSEISRTFALSIRLFGNMMSGQLIVALLVALAGVLVPAPMMALDLLIGFLQAYIFAVLATVYIGAAIRVGEES
ncbi:MAG TPA: F0F1 ATP synthase subunit A [Terriglobia bacterium]|nr:F0F1 ATP synthase subunit A [Terriglobia bacterium]